MLIEKVNFFLWKSGHLALLSLLFFYYLGSSTEETIQSREDRAVEISTYFYDSILLISWPGLCYKNHTHISLTHVLIALRKWSVMERTAKGEPFSKVRTYLLHFSGLLYPIVLSLISHGTRVKVPFTTKRNKQKLPEFV